MKKELKIYLGGSIRGLKAKDVVKHFDDMEAYIMKRCREAGIKCHVFSPIRGKKQYISEDGETWNNPRPLKEIIARDETDLRQCDIDFIMTGDTPTDGTWLEFGLCLYECKIPVVMIAPKRKNNELISWANEKATFIGKDKKECVDWIIDYWMA